MDASYADFTNLHSVNDMKYTLKDKAELNVDIKLKIVE